MGKVIGRGLLQVIGVALCCSFIAVETRHLDASNTERIPETFLFVDPTYNNNRFLHSTALVVGGTSGIGFAGAVMIAQECAQGVVLVGRNRRKGRLAEEIVRGVNRSHCPNNPVRVEYYAADITNATAVRGIFSYIDTLWGKRLDYLLTTAGIPGYISTLGDVPFETFHGKHDPIRNNLYGTMYVAYEALRFWNLTKDTAGDSGEAEGEADYVPSMVVMASEDGLVPSPVSLYAVSKAALIHLAKSISAGYGDRLRVNALAPGLVDTPFSWNQVRGCKVEGDALVCSSQLPAWQCYVNGMFVTNGDCSEGGDGYGCKCKDESREDKRQRLKWPGKLWPPIDPREVALRALDLLSNESTSASGQVFAIDNSNSSSTRGNFPWTRKQKLQCPPVTLETCTSSSSSTVHSYLSSHTPFCSLDHLVYLCTLITAFLLGRYSGPQPSTAAQKLLT